MNLFSFSRACAGLIQFLNGSVHLIHYFLITQTLHLNLINKNRFEISKCRIRNQARKQLLSFRISGYSRGTRKSQRNLSLQTDQNKRAGSRKPQEARPLYSNARVDESLRSIELQFRKRKLLKNWDTRALRKSWFRINWESWVLLCIGNSHFSKKFEEGRVRRSLREIVRIHSSNVEYETRNETIERMGR